MAHDQALEFYKIVRASPAMWQDLDAAEDTEALIAKVVTLSAAKGITLSPEDIRAALAELPNIIAEAAGDELSDDELELVASGSQSCGRTEMTIGK